MGCTNSKDEQTTTTNVVADSGNKESLLILGSSGYCGVATVKSLAAKYASSHKIEAAVRDVNSEKNAQLKIDGVELVAADMSKPESLVPVMKGKSSVFIVTPGHADRTNLAIAAMKACKEAGVGHMVVLSVCTAIRPGTIFGDQFIPIEAFAKESGVSHTIIRLPMFMENVLGQMGSIQSNGQFYTPLESDAKYNCCSLADVGPAVAEIMTHPKEFDGKVLELKGELVTETEIAAAFAAAMNKEVTHVKVPYEAAKEAMMGMGMPEWQVDGVIELQKFIESNDETMCTSSTDMADILKRPLTTPADLVKMVLA